MEDKYFFGYAEKQIEELTPDLAAACVISRLTWLVEDVQENGKGHFKEFYVTLVFRCDLNYKNIHKIDESVGMFIDQPLETFAESTNTFFILMSTVYALDAIGEYKSGRTQQAWILVLEAERYLGMAMGSVPNSEITKLVKSDQARRNAYKAREADIYSKKTVQDYYQEHINTFDSMADAVRKIIDKNLVLDKPNTIERWICDFHKKNPIISKPTKSKG